MTTDQLTHILDGNDVVIPYARMGHDNPHIPLALHYANVTPEPSPWTGRPRIAVGDDTGQAYLVEVTRIAHTSDCPTCAPIWAKYTALAQQAAKEGPHTMITAGYVVQLTNTTDAMVLVDAQDMADTDPA